MVRRHNRAVDRVGTVGTVTTGNIIRPSFESWSVCNPTFYIFLLSHIFITPLSFIHYLITFTLYCPTFSLVPTLSFIQNLRFSGTFRFILGTIDQRILHRSDRWFATGGTVNDWTQLSYLMSPILFRKTALQALIYIYWLEYLAFRVRSKIYLASFETVG